GNRRPRRLDGVPMRSLQLQPPAAVDLLPQRLRHQAPVAPAHQQAHHDPLPAPLGVALVHRHSSSATTSAHTLSTTGPAAPPAPATAPPAPAPATPPSATTPPARSLPHHQPPPTP